MLTFDAPRAIASEDSTRNMAATAADVKARVAAGAGNPSSKGDQGRPSRRNGGSVPGLTGLAYPWRAETFEFRTDEKARRSRATPEPLALLHLHSVWLYATNVSKCIAV